MATGHSSTSSENRASQSLNQDHVDDLLAHYAGLSQGSLEGRVFPPLRKQAQDDVPDYTTRGQESPRHFSAAAGYYPPAPARLETGGNIVSTSWDDLRETAADQAPSNYPTTAAEILDLLPLKLAYLSGGRDKEGLPIITFPTPPKNYIYNRDDIRRMVQYLASVPTDEVRQGGFCVILDARTTNWHTSKHILRTLQEALPNQIQVVYIVQPAHFWSKTKATHGYNKEKGKLEFSTVMVPDTKLTRYIEPNQLTEDFGGFLPYNHEQWIKLRQDLEHFISSFNALMEHNSRLEQQLKLDQPVQDLESAEDVLSRHNMLQDQFKKAPQSAVREANDLLRSLEQGRDVAGTSSVTPDKINAVSVIKKLLDNITRRQQQLDDLWRAKKTSLEQALQLQVFEKSMQKVRTWLKTRGEETLASGTDIGTNQESARAVQEQHIRFEAKATSILNNLTQLRRMADRLNGSNHFAADSLQRQVAKISNRFSRFEERMAERKKIVEASVDAHTSAAEWFSRCKEASSLFKEEAIASDLAMVEQLLTEHMDRVHQLNELATRASGDASNLLRLLESANSGEGGDSQLAQATKIGPQYTSAIDHVRHLLENVENLKKRSYELAEARKLRLEQYKQLFLCERDADQVIGLMIDMLNQVLLASGEVGNSLQNVLRLREEHLKFSDSAKKTYKYACDLLSTAQRSRKTLKMDTQVNDALLSNVNATWERLSSALQESQECLEMSQQFHASLEEVLACYIRWTVPINQLPRSSEFVERLSQEIVQGKEEWMHRADKCLQLGKLLLVRLQQLRPQSSNLPSDVLKRSQSYVRYRVEEVEARVREAPQVLDYHLGILKDFATYCSFELGIEQVLVWLQSQGLKTIQSLPRLGDTEAAVKEQLTSFDKFNNTCLELSRQVQQLHTQSAQTEALIRCFNSELVRKATSLKTVWEKFLARVVEWRETLHAALKLYELIGVLQTLLGELRSSLSSETVSKQGRGLEAYLGSLAPQRQRLLSLAATLPITRSALMKHQSVEHSIDTVTNIDRQLKTIEAERTQVEDLWLNAMVQLDTEKMKMVPRPLEANGLVKPREPLFGTANKSEREESVATKGNSSREELPVNIPDKKLAVKIGDLKKESSAGDQSKVEPSVRTGDQPKVEPLLKTGDQPKVEPVVKTGDQSKDESTVKSASLPRSGADPFLAKAGVAAAQSVETGKSARTYSLGSKSTEKPREKDKLKVALSTDALDRTSDKDKAMKDTELYSQLSTRAHKVLEWLEVECDGFFANNTQMGDTLMTAEKLKTLYEKFMESIQPSFQELTHAISELLALKSSSSSPSVIQSVTETCKVVMGNLGKRRRELQERNEILQSFVSFCTLGQEIESNLSKMNQLFSCELDPDSSSGSAQLLLEEHGTIIASIKETYPKWKDQGNRFIAAASPILTRKGESKLAVSSACAVAAVQLGELEGKYQLVLQDWEDKERTLKQIVEWHSFRSNVEQLTNRLTVPGAFLCDQTEFGSSAATAEDLLMEHDEFEAGAQRIASEVESLLALSEKCLASPHSHIAAAGMRKKAQELKTLHNSFKAQVSARHQGLLKSVAFFQGVEKLISDMDNTVKTIKEGGDIHGSLRLPSALARHAALTKEGEVLIKMAGSLLLQELRPKSQPSSRPDPYDQVIRHTLEGLKRKLDLYKDVVEGSQSSPLRKSSLGGGSGKRQVSELVIQQKSSPVLVRKEGVAVSSSPALPRKEGASGTPSPTLTKKEGVSGSSSPAQPRKEGVSGSFSPAQPRKEGALVASSPLLVRKEGSSAAKSEETASMKDSVNVQLEKISSVTAYASLADAKFSISLSVPLKARFSTTATRDIDFHTAQPVEQTSLIPTLSEPLATSKGGGRLVKQTSVAESIGSLQKKSESTTVPKATLTKRYSLDSTLPLESAVNTERQQREGTPPSGKVSSLRSMFDAMSLPMTSSTPSPQPQTSSHSSRAKSTPPTQSQISSHSTRAKSTPPIEPYTSSHSLRPTSVSPPVRFHSPDIIPMEQLSSNLVPPPRPPSPLDYTPGGTEIGLLESDCDSLSTFASSPDEEEREEEEEVVAGVEETDNDGRGQAEPKKIRSTSVVLSELKYTEQSYLNSLSALVEGYLPRFSDEHLPTFLVDKREALLANIDQIYNLHRNLSQVLTNPESSLMDICQCFSSNAKGFSAYVPYLSNLPKGLALLSEYGGTFFEECQRSLSDKMTLEDHCMQPRERVVEYWTLFSEMLACAEKDCLHAVAAIKDTLCIIQGVARTVDNFVALASLKDCPLGVRPEGVVRRELFHLYKPMKKKKMKEVLVILHQDYVIFTQPKAKISWRDMTLCEFVDSLDVHSLMLIETYKRHKERFALSNHLGNADNIFVLQPVLKDTMIKPQWIKNICQLLGTTPVEGHSDLGIQNELLPLFFRTSPLTGGDNAGRNGSVKRKDSKRTSSLKRRVSAKEVPLVQRDIKKRGRLDGEEQPVPPVASVQLATFQSGAFCLAKQPANTNMYVVVQPYLSRRDSFLTVGEGQLVEVLDSNGPNWLVMTVAKQGEMEEEGFLPASCLKRVGEGLPNPDVTGFHEGAGQVNVALDDKKNKVEEALLSAPAQTVYYVKETSDPHTTPGLKLEAGQAVEVLDSSDARWWLVQNRDTLEEGMVAPSSLSRFPVSKLDGGSSLDDLLSPDDKLPPNATAVFDHRDPTEKSPRTPEGVFGEVSSPVKAATPCSPSEMSLKRTTPIPDLSITSSTLAEHISQGVFGLARPRPLLRLQRSASFPDLSSIRNGSPPSLEKKCTLTHSLPVSLATLECISGDAVAKNSAGFSMTHRSGLQRSLMDQSLMETVGSGERDAIFVAVADFTPSERSSIPLVEGQEVKILDSSRPDWWLIHCLNTSKEGWVPASYLKKRNDQGVLSDNLYRFPFLVTASGRNTPELLALQKDTTMLHVATCDHPSEQEGQLALTKGQRVHVVDSKLNEWWLCSTTSPEQSATGWVRAQSLIPCISISEEGTELPKSAVSLGVALADCLATEPGTIDIREGEVLEVIDNSRHDWCLVRRTVFKEPSEGWVRSSFIKDCSKGENNGNLQMTPWHARTGSNESDFSDQCEPQLSLCLSPETNVEPYEDENQRKEAREKRDCVLSELLKTEKEYVEKLEYCLENYWRPMGDASQPKALRTAQDVIFANLVDIYKFHHDTFQHKLTKCQEEPVLLGDTFVEAQDSLQMYISYCQSKSRALETYREFISFFEDLRSQLKGRLELPDYLILPVQRITKYTLLLQDFQKYSMRAGIEAGKIELALDVTRGISASANAAIHLSMLEGQDKLDLGPLILQDAFGVQEGPKPFKDRRMFLFKKGLIITRRKRDSSEKESYVVKDQLMLSDISVTQDMDKAKRNLIIYHKTTGNKFTLRTTSSSVKAAWLKKINELIKESKGARLARPKSASDSADRLSKSPSFLAGKGSLKREASQRKQSMKALKTQQANEESAPPGTKYIVMECIVMEGGDDVTLEPGDEVELVRMDGSGSLRVKTVDDSIEGNVPKNYLRRKDSVITGVSMAAAPRFTMNLSNLHLLYGSTATISCAFNGYPPPSVCWKHDDNPIQPNTPRIKVTSCATSSVLEVISLDYEDMGYYSCYITNSMGSVHTAMGLSLYGPPSQPPKPSVSNVHSSSVKLRWGPPEYDGTSPVTAYEIESLQEGFGEWHQIAQHSRNSCVVKSLEQNTSYVFRIVAINEFGASKPSEQSDCVLTKTKGWLVSSPITHKKPMLSEGKDVTDFVYDDFDDGANGALSPPFPDVASNLPTGPASYGSKLSRKESFVNHYVILQEELGRGRFGIVYKCIDRQTNQMFAAKHVRIRTKRKAEIRSEVQILKAVAGISPHVLEFQGAFEKDKVLHIVTELVPDGELFNHIIAENCLTERVAVFYLSQLLQGLEAIHRLNIVHLDVKPENLMLSRPVLKLIDFGSAKDCGVNNTPLSISNSLLEFVAPEVMTQEAVTPAVDMWSVGVLTYVLLTGISPFFADNLHKTTEKIKEAKYSLEDTVFEQISPEAKDFIFSLLQKSPEQRLSANRALKHIWIRMLNTGGTDAVPSSPWPMPHLSIAQLKSFVTRRKRHMTVTAVDHNYIFGQRINSSLLSPALMETDEFIPAAPVLWGGPNDPKLNAQVGSSLSLEWHFGGTPTPSVVWEHNQTKITPSDRVAIRTEGEVASVTITNVVRSDEGTYMCCAMNSVGTEARKVQVAVLDKPSSPTAITAIRLSRNSALVSWQPPSDTGNAPILGYTLEQQQVGFNTWELASGEEEVLQSAAHIVENLLPDGSYRFRVAAVNQVGASPFSEPANLVDSGDSESSTFEDMTGQSQDSVKEQSFDAMYEVKQVLSCGAYSIVSKCLHRTTGTAYAAKCVSFSLGESVVMKQFQIHQQSTHTRIVTLVESFETDRDMTMILEYLPGGNLAYHVKESTVLSEMETSRFTRQILEGIQYLHKSGIIHSNVRPENILLSNSRTELKLTDFRLSRSITTSNQFEAIPEEPDFMAPEAIELKSLTPSADIWSVGILVLFMLLGKSVLLGSNDKETLANIRTCQWYKKKNELSNMSQACREFLIEKTLIRNPRRRTPASECLAYPWLRPQSVSSFIHSSTMSQDSPPQKPSNSMRSYSLSQDF